MSRFDLEAETIGALMFTPRTFREEDTSVLHDLMQRYSFATLATWSEEGPAITHVPFMLDRTRGPNGTLITHLARANPHWRKLDGEREALVIFMGPHAYISPAWYANQVTVPTWNYAAVHAHGVPQIVRDPEVLRSQVLRLTDIYEAYVDPPWNRQQMESILPTELQAIVGIEIPILRLVGKYKFSQNRPLEDRVGVIGALEQAPDPMARDVAAIMRDHLAKALA